MGDLVLFRPRPRMVSFLLTIQEPAADEGAGATGLTMGGCMGSGSQIPMKEGTLEGGVAADEDTG